MATRILACCTVWLISCIIIHVFIKDKHKYINTFNIIKTLGWQACRRVGASSTRRTVFYNISVINTIHVLDFTSHLSIVNPTSSKNRTNPNPKHFSSSLCCYYIYNWDHYKNFTVYVTLLIKHQNTNTRIFLDAVETKRKACQLERKQNHSIPRLFSLRL